MYSTLQRAIEAGSTHVVAEDVSTDGKKQFYAGTLAELRAVYETKSAHHWYECLMEGRASRLFLDVDAKTQIDIHAIVAKLRTAVTHLLEHRGIHTTPNIEIMDSSGQDKYSWHILVTNAIFRNVYHVGAFVRKLLLYYEDCPEMQTIDSAVYTRNRMFRLPGSSKFGSARVLASDKPWWQLLVQVPTAAPLDCMEIDGSLPASTSAPPGALFRENEDGTWARVGRQHDNSYSTAGTTLLSPVLDWLDHHEQAQTTRYRMKLLGNGTYCVSSKSRRCHIAGRTHRGNHVWFQLDLSKRQIAQRCMDAECGKRKHIIACPAHIWDRWTTAWMCAEPAPNNQNTLYNVSY